MKIPTFVECEKFLYASLRKFGIAEPFDDFLQDAYFIYHSCCEKYDGSLSKFTTYFVYKFEYHLKSYLRDEHRKRQTLHLLPSPPMVECPMDEPLLLLDILHHHRLTPLEQEIFLLSYKGLPMRLIATRKQISLSTVKRTRKQIKQKLLLDAV
ncbi:sigma-70 family RNA polymerase sigma factor [Halobacillus salinus]|uniref:sigma-70 family RNA polymerase sigma factor n=1 Tax=Halobacillus salinus TaxID=192814 RepID=UPI0015928532|nr:sigma-70 family RNA polymerase sigma factor [Halobacillus salinus]